MSPFSKVLDPKFMHIQGTFCPNCYKPPMEKVRNLCTFRVLTLFTFYVRNSCSNRFAGSDEKEMGEMESGLSVFGPDFIRVMESSILTFRDFLKMDKKKSNGVLNLFGYQNQMATPLQLTQSVLDKVIFSHAIFYQ